MLSHPPNSRPLECSLRELSLPQIHGLPVHVHRMMSRLTAPAAGSIRVEVPYEVYEKNRRTPMGKLEANDGKWKSMRKFWTSQHLAGLSSFPLQTCPWYNPISGETYMGATENGVYTPTHPNQIYPNSQMLPQTQSNQLLERIAENNNKKHDKNMIRTWYEHDKHMLPYRCLEGILSLFDAIRLSALNIPDATVEPLRYYSPLW